MRHKRVLFALALSAQTAFTLSPAWAQYESDLINVDDITQDSSTYTPDLINVDDITAVEAVNEVPTTQIPDGLGGIVYNILGDDNPNTINPTQAKFLQVFDYGQKALDAYRLGKDIYKKVGNIIKDPDGFAKDALTAILDDYNKIGSNIPGTEAGGDGPSEKIFDDPSTPGQVYIQAKNDVAQRMFLPSLMTQLVFGEDARTLREQQSTQLEDSITNTIEASQNLVQLSGSTVQAVAQNGDLAGAVGEETANAQKLKSSQAVLKSIAASDGIRSQQTATNGVILGSIQQSQVEQNRATTALVVSSALAYQQRDVQNHQLASQNVFLEQIRADLGQQEDEQQRAAFAKVQRQANITSNILIPGLFPDSSSSN